MSTHAFGRVPHAEVRVWHGLSVHWAWLAGGFVLAFAVPYVLADVFAINRDVFYGLYALAVIGLFALWSRSTGYDLVAAAKRHWIAALLLGWPQPLSWPRWSSERRTPPSRPDGAELAGAVAWRASCTG